jgi:hypothetical protein
MSNFDNFVSDFPGRCAELFRDFEAAARLRKREVTLLLSVAAPSIVIPLERLAGPKHGPTGAWPGHPSRDWQRFQEAKAKLDVLLDQPFLGSALWPESSASSWSFDELADVSRDPDFWPELQQPKPVGPNKKAKTVVWHVRKALAHGNIFTRGRPDIEQIILLSQVAQNVYKFSFLAVAPADFRGFLRNWLDFLRELRLPTEVVPEFAEAAA